MENLRKSLETLRKENLERKLEIIRALEELIKDKSSLNDSQLNDRTFLINICEYEKKLHEKLTEIQFELHKFVVINETPVYKSRVEPNPDPNIGVLIANITKLLPQLEQLSSQSNPQSADSQETLYQNSIKKLNDHSKNVLKDLSFDVKQPDKETFIKREEKRNVEKLTNINADDYCGHHPQIHDNFPKISRSCSSSSVNTAYQTSENACPHFPTLSTRWPELDQLCQTVNEEKPVEDNRPVRKTSKEVDDEMQKNIMELASSYKTCNDSSFTKLNNVLTDDMCDAKEESTSSEAEGSYSTSCQTPQESDSDQKPVSAIYTNLFGVPTSVLKNEHCKNFPRVQNNLDEDADFVETEDEQPTSDKQSPLKDCNLNANNAPTSPFSAEEKLLKLGVYDRREAFEKSRSIAPLPDIRLQPSDSSSTTNSSSNKYVLSNGKIPKLYVHCVVSYVETPSEFYIHVFDEATSLLDELNQMITDHFKTTKTPFRSKIEASNYLGKYCCAYVKNDSLYYRVEIDNWLFDQESSKLVIVRLVDYGCKVIVHYKHLRELTKRFSCVPKAAIKCYLPMLYPPGSTRSNLLKNWPPASIEEFKEVTGVNEEESRPTFKISYYEDQGDITAIDFYRIDDKHLTTIGQVLIDLGHAVQIILPEDDPMGILMDDEDIQRFEECNNINEVVLGYDPKDEGRICKFTRKDGTCYKGKNCNLEHVELPQGGYTTDKILTFVGALNKIILPRVGEFVDIRFTGFIEPSHYYINFTKFVETLSNLENIINDIRNTSTLNTFKIMPAFGEIVLVKHWNRRWLRAKIKHHYYNDDGHCIKVQVFMVDYGDIIDAPLSDIRQIRPEYLDVPFQAIECVLYNYKKPNNIDMKEADKFFYQNMVSRDFVARVMAVTDLMYIQVFHKNNDLGEILYEKGYLTKDKRQCPSFKAVAIPSG